MGFNTLNIGEKGMIQAGLPFREEIVVDLFAGGGGASHGIEQGIGRSVDVAVNHDPEAVAMHKMNHPGTTHYCESVFKVDPGRATGNQPVGLLWASPDCTHHSKAKGGKPVSNKRRGLAWVVVKWARRVRPRVIMLENVEEFEDWGPLTKEGKPCPVRKGQEFKRFVAQLQRQGYQVEHRVLRACDYGAPTIRKRLFLVARRDGLPIRWPKPTHGAPDTLAVKRGKLQPWRTAAECIDWNLPAPSIFARKKPLAQNTLARIARGIHRFVLESPAPFLMTIDHQSSPNGVYNLDAPLTTITSKARHCLVSAFLAKHYGGVTGIDVRQPTGTVTTVDHHSLVAALMAPYYGSGSGTTGRDLRSPAPTITCTDRLQLITVEIDDTTYVLADIGMRMLQPRELYRAQGFPDSYIIDRGPEGETFTKKAQVRMCGNSVPPPFAEALVRENFVHERRSAA